MNRKKSMCDSKYKRYEVFKVMMDIMLLVRMM